MKFFERIKYRLWRHQTERWYLWLEGAKVWLQLTSYEAAFIVDSDQIIRLLKPSELSKTPEKD